MALVGEHLPTMCKALGPTLIIKKRGKHDCRAIPDSSLADAFGYQSLRPGSSLALLLFSVLCSVLVP